MNKPKKRPRTIKQIIAAVKGAVLPVVSSAIVVRRHAGAIAIRLSSTHFVLVRDVLDIGGVMPGDMNIFADTAVEAASAMGIITTEEAERLYAWREAETASRARAQAEANLESEAQRLGFVLVKKVTR